MFNITTAKRLQATRKNEVKLWKSFLLHDNDVSELHTDDTNPVEDVLETMDTGDIALVICELVQALQTQPDSE